MGAWCLALFHPGSPSKNSHSVLTQHSKNSGNGFSILPGHFALESVGPQKLLNIITESPNQTLIKGSSDIWGASFRSWFKKQNPEMSVGMFCCVQCAVGLDVAPCCGNSVLMTSELHAAAVQEEAWCVWGSCYSRRKAVLQEWKQSFLWLRTNLCHTFLLLVPYNWAHPAIMRNCMDRQVKQCSRMRSHPAAHYIQLVQNVMCWHHGDTWIWIHSSPCLPHGSCR